MSNINWDDFTPIGGSAKPAGPSQGGAVNWDDFTPVESGGAISDIGKSLKVGVQRLPGIAAGLADLPTALTTGARPFTKAADVIGEATGFQPGKWADETKFSQGYEQGKQAVDAAWKDGSASDIALSYLKNPGYTANQVAESVPSMIAGGLAGRAIMGAGAVSGSAGNAATGLAARAAAPGTLARTVGEKWAAPVAAGIGEGAVTAGQQMAQYQGDDQQQNALASLGAGVGTGLIGVGAGRVANRLGLETAETAITKLGTGAAKAADEVPLSAKRRILGGMVSEAVLQELPQSAQEQMWQNWADGKPLMDGVARAATEGAIAGGVMGAGANIRGGKPSSAANPEAAEPPAPADAPLSLGYSPLAGTPTVFPDGSVALNGEDELAYRYALQPEKPSQSMGIDPGAGPLSKAAATAVDSGAYMPPAGQAQEPAPEPDPVVLQNRDRTSAASIAQMQEIAANPDYLRVGPSRDMTSGAPIVFGELPPTALLGRPETVVDGHGERMGTQYAVVDAGDLIASNNADGTAVAEYASGAPGKLRSVAGNGRTAGLQAAYELGTAQRYRQELAGDAASLGVDAQALAAMQRPVLVRVMQGADVTRDMGDRTNITATQKLSPLEQAGNDARRLDVRALSFDEGGNPTPDSIKGFVSAMPVAERGDMLNADGTPTRQAVDRLMAATFKQAYESDELVQLYAQASDPDARAVMAAAADASGVLANLKGAGEFDVRAAVADAAKMAVNAARQGLKLSDVLQNQDMDMHPEAFPVAAYLAQHIRTPKRMAEGLRRWGQLALEQARIAEENTRQGSLLGPRPTLTRAEIFARLGSEDTPAGQAIAPPSAQGAPEPVQAEMAQAQPDQPPQGEPNGNQADQAKQAAPQRAQAQPAQGLTNAATPQNDGAQIAATPAAQGQTQGATQAAVAQRPDNWRTSLLRAAPVAREMGIDPKGRRLAQVVAEVEAMDAEMLQAQMPAAEPQSLNAPPPEFASFDAMTSLLKSSPELVSANGDLNERGNSLARTPWDSLSAQDRAMVHGLSQVSRTASESYNDRVREQERQSERRRLQGDRLIQQKNGKPFKKEANAQAVLDQFGLSDTHVIQPADGGFVLRQMPPAAQAEALRKAEGRESYMQAQAAVLAEMGIGENASGEIDATDAQWSEIERRTDARLRATGRVADSADRTSARPDAQNTKSPASATPGTAAIFSGLDGRGMKKKRAQEEADAHPRSKQIAYVQDNFHDILIGLMDSGQLAVNGQTTLTKENKSCL